MRRSARWQATGRTRLLRGLEGRASAASGLPAPWSAAPYSVARPLAMHPLRAATSAQRSTAAALPGTLKSCLLKSCLLTRLLLAGRRANKALPPRHLPNRRRLAGPLLTGQPPARRLAGRPVTVAVLAAALLAALVGCGASGPPRAAVKGRVTLDGQPLTEGSIHFVPVGQTKGPLAAARIVNGEYSLSRADGPVVGRVRVEIYSPTGSEIPLDDPLAFAAADASAVPQERLPARYNRASNQFVDVKSEGENIFDFQLTSDP